MFFKRSPKVTPAILEKTINIEITVDELVWILSSLTTLIHFAHNLKYNKETTQALETLKNKLQPRYEELIPK